MYFYIVCEKSYIERLGKRIDDERNLHDSNSVDGIKSFLEKQNINITKRAIYNAIKNKNLIANKYSVYKIKSEVD